MTPTKTTDRLSDELGQSLIESGVLSPDWAPAFAAVPRSAFLPDLMWAHDMTTGRATPVDRLADEVAWMRIAYENVPLITQWDDGEHNDVRAGTLPTSSASMPSVVAGMLRDLDIADGMRVLEIGTGTGWNAGLLAWRLGGGRVFSVEVDAQVAAAARSALDRIGLRPTVECADGTRGYPPGAPYDRVIATAGVRSVPAAWIEQTRVGGVILAPWGSHYSNQEALVRLSVGADGSASGPFLRPVEFMTLRDQRLDWARFSGYVGADYAKVAGSVSVTAVCAEELGDRYTPQIFVIGLGVPRCAHVVNEGESGARAWFFDLDTVSWAVVEFKDGEPEAAVYQSGPRGLWDEVEAAWRWWTAHGQPGIDRFGLTVHIDGRQETWLDEPDQLVPTSTLDLGVLAHLRLAEDGEQHDPLPRSDPV